MSKGWEKVEIPDMQGLETRFNLNSEVGIDELV